jgi:O-antigen ligase
VFYGAFGLLGFGPLAFGGVEPWAVFVLEGGVTALFVLWMWNQVTAGELRATASPLFPPMVVFVGLIVLQIASGRTAYRYQTIHTGMLYCTYGLLCFLIVQCFRRTSQVNFLAFAISVFGFGVAVFAIFQSVSSDGKLYWFRTPSEGGWIYGPYVNHNHYAGLIEMLLPIPLVVSVSNLVPQQGRKLALIAAAIMASTIFLSGSRGGMLAFLVQMALLAVFLVRRKKNLTTALALAAFLTIFLGLLVWLGGDALSSRIASIRSETNTEISGGTRLAIVRDGLKMFAARPLIGWGLGTFPEAYPQYRSFYTNLFVNQAHNDYLQLLVEMGILGFAAMIWFLVTMYYHAAKKLGNWTSNSNGAIAVAAILGCTGILVHSFVDFNLQIPANAALFYVLCALGALEPRFPLLHHRPTLRRSSVNSELSA